MIIGYKKRFASDLLQRSYADLAEAFGFSKREITAAIIRLEQLGVLRRVFRTVDKNGTLLGTVLYIELIPEGLKKITYPEPSIDPVPDNPKSNKDYIHPCTPRSRKSVGPYENVSGGVTRTCIPPYTPRRDSYTKNTTETTTDNHKPKYNACAREGVTEDEYGNPVPDPDWLRVQNCYVLNLRSQFPQGVREDDLWNLYKDMGADVMCYAIEETSRTAGDSNSAYSYLHKVLTNWQKQNVHSLDQAKLEHAKHQRNAKASKPASQPTYTPDKNVREFY